MRIVWVQLIAVALGAWARTLSSTSSEHTGPASSGQHSSAGGLPLTFTYWAGRAWKWSTLEATFQERWPGAQMLRLLTDPAPPQGQGQF